MFHRIPLVPLFKTFCIVTYLLCSTTLDNILHCILLLLLYSSLLYSTLSSPPSACHCHFPLSLRLSLSLLIYLHIPFSSLLLRSIQQYLILLLSFNLPTSLSLYSPSPSLLSIYFFHFPFLPSLPCFLYLILQLFLHVLGGCSSFLERNRAGLAERSVLHFPETRSIRPYQTIARYVRANF